MEKMMIVTLGLIAGYVLFRFVNKKPKKVTDSYFDILNNDKFKVKDQWER